MSKKLTLDDLIIEEHPGGQNCRSCPLFVGIDNNVEMMHFCAGDTCLTHTITLKPATDEQL